MDETFLHAESGGFLQGGNIVIAPWYGKAILLVDLDAFFAAVEQLDHPAWRGRPVIVGGDADKRGVVATASYEARAFGVHSAMPSSTARALCPDAIWTGGSHHRYREMSKLVMEILIAESPFVQQVSIDEAFVDVSPTPHNTEHPVAVAHRIQEGVARLGITCSIGVGTSKTVAKIASDMDKPQGLTVVYPGREKDFLSPLPVRSLSGIGASAERELKRHGIETLGGLAAADPGLLARLFGKNGRVMYIRANGGDDSPIETEEAVKSVSHEISFAQDLTVLEDIEPAVAAIASRVGRRMRLKGLRGHTLGLKVRYGDRTLKNVQRHLAQGTDDELAFTPILLDMLKEVWKPGVAVRLLGVGLSGFTEEGGLQERLFDLAPDEGAHNVPKALISDPKKRSGLLHATDHVRDRFGEDAVQFGHEMKIRGHTTNSSSKNPSDYK